MGAIEAVMEQWADTKAELEAYWDANTHHGCFCGAGKRCDKPIDGLDAACEQHDAGYRAVGISAEVMWEWESLKQGVEADEALVALASSADILAGASTSNPDVDAYRERLIWIFSTRAQIGRALAAVDSAVDDLVDGATAAYDYVADSASDAVDAVSDAAGDAYEYIFGDE